MLKPFHCYWKLCNALITNLKGDCLFPEIGKTEKNDKHFRKMRILSKKIAKICDNQKLNLFHGKQKFFGNLLSNP